VGYALTFPATNKNLVYPEPGGVGRSNETGSDAGKVSFRASSRPQRPHRYGCSHIRYDAEIEAHLRIDHWQDEKNADQDHYPFIAVEFAQDKLDIGIWAANVRNRLRCDGVFGRADKSHRPVCRSQQVYPQFVYLPGRSKPTASMSAAATSCRIERLKEIEQIAFSGYKSPAASLGKYGLTSAAAGEPRSGAPQSLLDVLSVDFARRAHSAGYNF
jgi:hypothetical protein